MNENILCAQIAALRRDAGMTQEQLASRLGLTYQAVSKWENGQSCPDVMLLPDIADIFGVSVDTLFGRTPAEAQREDAADLPWPDDENFYAVLYQGHRLQGQPTLCEDAAKTISLHYDGPARDVTSAFAVNCGDVEGDVTAGGDVRCGDVEGDATAGGDLRAGDVSGDVRAGGDANCDQVEGDVAAGRDVHCADIGGDVTAAGSVNCQDVDGNILCGSGFTRSQPEDDAEDNEKKPGIHFELKTPELRLTDLKFSDLMAHLANMFDHKKDPPDQEGK